jgi:hypothetical protein
VSYKIKSVGKNKDIQSNFGPLRVYDVEFEGEGWVEITQKPDSPAPQIGQDLDGTIEDTKWGKKFRRAQANYPGGGGGFRKGGDSPETRRSIQAQSALNAAERTVFGFYSLQSDDKLTLEKYRDEIIMVAKAYEGHLGNENQQTTITQPAPTTTSSDLPPASLYDDMPEPFNG